VQELVDETRAGSVRAASRLITLLEDNPSLVPQLLLRARDWPQVELILGITGAPGVGKSSVVDRLIAEWRVVRPDWRLAVVAVDPSSVFTGGAVLGDRVRMMAHANDPQVFIRSLANRGHLGGLTLGIRGIIRVLGLLGCRLVFLETVGVGQSEVEVSSVSDITAVLLAPGHGDSIQMIKAGVLETGDIFVINKSDREGAERLSAELRGTLKFTTARVHGLPPEIVKVSAARNSGLSALREAIEARAEKLASNRATMRSSGERQEVREFLLEASRHRISAVLEKPGVLEKLVERLARGDADLATVTSELLSSAGRAYCGDRTDPTAPSDPTDEKHDS